MHKAFLALVVVLVFCFPVFAGTYLMNDTGQTVYGLRVTFSEPVIITAFGDALTAVHPTGQATQFTFSSGQVSASGGQWFNWEPAEAKLLSHEWLRTASGASFSGSGEAIQLSGITLPKTVTTRFPIATPAQDVTSLPSLEFSTTPASSYSPSDSLLMQPIDRFTLGSQVPLEWWYSYSVLDEEYTFTPLTPDEGQAVMYRYPQDGNTGVCTLMYKEPVDLSTCNGIQIVASADHPVDVYVTIAICDDAVTPEPDEDYPCGRSSVTYSVPIHVTADSQVFVLPFSKFEISPWVLSSDTPFTPTPRFSGITEIMFDPDDEQGVLELHKVSSVKQIIPVQAEGPEINEYYFQHPACVMQGVDDLDSIYALPLEGIPELGTGYVAKDPDSEELFWEVETSDPGIGAGFEDDTLYIWGADASWSGYVGVTLTVSDETGACNSIEIPVTVFRQDKTLINEEGKKDYFIPWSPQLDINRILSVEEHIRIYHKDDGKLDRSIQWSQWKKMEPLKDVEVIKWANAQITQGSWSQASQFAFVDEVLREIAELGTRTIRFALTYYLPTPTATTIVPVYNRYNYGPSLTPEEAAYVINEAHRLGLQTLISNWIGVDSGPPPGVPKELGDATPSNRADFWHSYEALVMESMSTWYGLGVDFAGIDTIAYTLPNTAEHRVYINAQLQDLATAARVQFPGPIALIAGGPWPGWFNPWPSILYAPFWKAGDILCAGISLNQLDPLSPSLATNARVLERWHNWIEKYFQPFQQRFNKPFIANENGCIPVVGALVGKYYAQELANPVIDLSQMTRYYVLQDEAFRDMEGYYGPGWFAFAFGPGRPGSVRDPEWNARMKVEDVLRSIFCGAPSAAPICIDADLSDWNKITPCLSDLAGDTSGTADLLSVSFVADENYLYFRVDYTAPPHGYLFIDLDSDGDRKRDAFIRLTDLYTRDGTWWGNSYVFSPDGQKIGIADSIDAGRSLEIRVPIRFLQGHITLDHLAAQLVHANERWRNEDETAWFQLVPIPEKVRSQ